MTKLARRLRRQDARTRRKFRHAVFVLLGSHTRNADCDRGPLQRSIWSLAVDSRESMRVRTPTDEVARAKLLSDLVGALARIERREQRQSLFRAALFGIAVLE